MEEMSSEGEDSSDSEFLNKCQQELEQSLINKTITEKKNELEKGSAEKRKDREDDCSVEDDFITVVRRRPKRLVRSKSTEMMNIERVDENKNDEQSEQNTMHEVKKMPINY
ncbi:unnamed protein product [Arctia plantaginis]|uniref:Uncharacterized protein n=1 Tax=Arctia plantaginis TaxID=874455 RepID=A0A8S1B4V2_ARCPL|nr:unnamed protein product [Arctia plantaginis]